jgi:hypothetical protein
MIGKTHGVFLVYLALCLVWNLLAARSTPAENDRPGRAKTPWEQRFFLPLMCVLIAVLVRDRLVPNQASWLTGTWARHLFPLAFLLAALQNTLTILRRGVRLTDIPIVLYNVGLGSAVVVADLAVSGVQLDTAGTTLLHDHSLLQLLLGTHMAQVWTLSWHVPLLLRRRPPVSLLDALGGLLPSTLAAFAAVVLVVLHGSAERVLQTFALEPGLERVRDDLAVGVLARPAGATPLETVGDLRAWVLPADHSGDGLPPDDGRPLVVVLRAPDAWALSLPDPETCETTFEDGAQRLARALKPAVLIPFPEPDGEGTLFFGAEQTPRQWGDRVAQAARRIRMASPETRVAMRLWGHGRRSEELYEALAPSLDIMGPRLQPGGQDRGGAAFADELLGSWIEWRAGQQNPPSLWILAAGLSPLAFGERAHAFFVEGCLARASALPEVEALLIEGWRDRGHTQGLLRPDGAPRRALLRLQALLRSRPPAPGR